MLTLHVDPITVNCRKVLAGLQLIGVEYEQVTMSIFSEDHKEDSYLAFKPQWNNAVNDGKRILSLGVQCNFTICRRC
jgi:glutathione S-transferase